LGSGSKQFYDSHKSQKYLVKPSKFAGTLFVPETLLQLRSIAKQFQHIFDSCLAIVIDADPINSFKGLCDSSSITA
jgi:hypothetical protein